MYAAEGFTRYLDKSQEVSNAAELDKLFLDVADHFFGFPFVTYGNALHRGKMDETFVSTTVDNGWWSHYMDEDYAQVDPVFSLLPYKSGPFAWTECLEFAPERGRQCLREGEEAGLTNGVSLSLREPGQFYAVSFAGRPDRATKPEMAALNAISNLYHARRQELSDGEPEGALTPAELRYLRWFAQGKTISETAEICGVADISVSKGLSEAYQKLGENGRVRTVLKLVGLPEVTGIEGLATDIRARKIAEESLLRSRKLEAVGQLTGGIAHDYNNMLGVIIGNIQMVEGAAALDDKSRQRLGKALAAAQRNAKLTAKLLGLSRSQAGGTKPTAANDFIAGLEEVIAKSLTASIEVRTDLADDLWLVDIDPAELEDMILNLAINARDAMPRGGVLAIETTNKVLDEEDVSCIPGSQAGDYVVIAVSDTGTGISQDIREQIFDPFFSTKETGKGTGLGLSMVYAFVQRSGGFIKVYSEPGEGSTFNVFLPRTHCKAENRTAPEKNKAPEPSRGSETILVVDDEEFLVDLAVTQLEDLGYRTLSADNGEKALEILKADPDIDLLFTDIIMPGKLDGYDLALAARQVHPAQKILLTSGFAKQREKLKNGDNETLTRLAANLLSKPYMLTELATAVRRSLDEND